MLSVETCDGAGRRIGDWGVAKWLAGVVPTRYAGEVTIALVTDATSRRLNRTYRAIDRATDVLSFPSSHGWSRGRWVGAPAAVTPRPSHFGDIVIARGVAARQARRLGLAVAVELRVLALHGFLHLVGFDHERDDGEMRAIEARWRRRGSLELGLTERATRT